MGNTPYIGQRLKKIRIANNYTLKEVAFYTQVKISSVQKIERNDQRPPLDFLMRFGKMCKMSLDALADFHLEDEEPGIHLEMPFRSTDFYNLLSEIMTCEEESRKVEIIEKLWKIHTSVIDENETLRKEVIDLVKSLKKVLPEKF